MNPIVYLLREWRAFVMIGGLGAVLILSGCESNPAGAAGSRESAATGEGGSPSAAEGRRLYYGRCTSCHAPEPVSDYTRSEWRSELVRMRKRAKLTPAEEASLLAFVMRHAADA